MAVTAGALALAVGIGAQPAIAGPEGSLAAKVNSARTSNGRAAVQVYWDLTDDARAHAKKMMERREVFTNPNIGSATSGWKALGQVVGVGPGVGPLFDAFMASSAQRNTVLGSSYNYMGVGVATSDDGKIWVSMIFMLGPEGLVDPPPATTTTSTSTTTTAATTATTASTTATSRPSQSTGSTAPPSPVLGTTPADSSNSGNQVVPPATEPPGAQAATSTTDPTPETGSSASSRSSTTSTSPAASGDGRPTARADATGPGSETGSPGGGWMILGVAGLAGVIFLVVVGTSKSTQSAATMPARLSGTAFDACRRCGLVFNHHKKPACPKCGIAT